MCELTHAPETEFPLDGFTSKNPPTIEGELQPAANGGSHMETSPVGNGRLINKESVNVYPNPVRDKLTLNLSSANSNSIKVEIINVLGITVKQIQLIVKNKTSKMDVSQLPPGIYLIRINNQFTGKFEKIK